MRNRTWLWCGIALVALIVLGLMWEASTDPFCRRGYIADDGTCAWE